MTDALRHAVLLASGGLDSTTLAYELEAQGLLCHPLFVDYGQHCSATELTTLKEVLPPSQMSRLHVVHVGGLYQLSQSRLILEPDLWTERVQAEHLYLPYRSLLLLTVGAAYAQSIGATRVYAAFINSNHAHEIDCTRAFFVALEGVLGGYGGVELVLPYRDISKLEVARKAIALRSPIGRTYSCQASASIACGACPNCVDRLDALAALQSELES